MLGKILNVDVVMLGINLPKPFPLAFGTLYTLPRVFLILTFNGKSGPMKCIGEASIDFPFSHYDAWDVYHALAEINLKGLNINQRLQILNDDKFRALLEYPAAFTAINMALDDGFGKLNHVSIPDLYGMKRITGQVLDSISMPKDIQSLSAEFNRVIDKGNVPKLKGGQGVEADCKFLQAALAISSQRDTKFAVDFNAAYSVKEFESITNFLKTIGQKENTILFFEQPTLAHQGIDALNNAKKHLVKCGLNIPVMADESFIHAADAFRCEKIGILLNYKIQKIGGILVATEIEKSLGVNQSSSMVGGTFPTAIGRIWDQQALCVLKSATLPSDGWQPSTDWFDGDRHLVNERFSKNAFISDGLGATVRWELFDRYKITDPKGEYRLIRRHLPGKQIQIVLKEGVNYSDLYEKLNEKPSDWNL